jgi:hypothetical protein
MANHQLSIEVSKFCNPKVLRIFDTSYYCSDDVIENYLIEVLAPQKSVWITFFVQKNFSLITNSSALKYRKVADVADLIDLPDGIYEIKQSYKPNAYTVSHFYHLRTVDLRLKLKAEWDKLVGDKCNISREEYIINRDRLREIDEYILAAEYKVEECHEKKEGKEMYEFVTKLLEIYTNECQC